MNDPVISANLHRLQMCLNEAGYPYIHAVYSRDDEGRWAYAVVVEPEGRELTEIEYAVCCKALVLAIPDVELLEERKHGLVDVWGIQ